MTMEKLQKYILKGLPLCILLLILFSATSAHADWLDTIWGKIREGVGKMAAEALGIDTEDNCTPPGAGTANCMFCHMFKILFNAGSAVAEKSYSAFSSDLGQLVIVFLGVSLALIVLRNIATMGAKDPGALLNDLFKKTFIGVAIYIIIAKDYYNILNLTLTPVFDAGLSFVRSGGDTCASAGGIHGYASTAGSGTGGGLPMSVGTSIVCAVEDIEHKIGSLFEFGKWAFCRGNGPDRLFYILPNPIYIIDGILLYIAGIFFMITYPWVMGDAVLQLGVAMAIAPFALCGYAFSGTKQYLPKVWSWVLNSLFVFMFMAILLTCILGYIGDLLGNTLIEGAGDPTMVFTNPTKGIAFYGPNMLKIIFILIIGWAYMPTISQLAGQFAGGSGLSAAGKIGDTIKKTIDTQSSKAANWAAGAAGNAAKSTARVTARRAKAGIRRGMMAGVGLLGARNAMGGKTVKFMGYKFSTEKNASGKQVLRREFKSITGRKHVMISDKYSTIKKEYARDGREIKSETTFKHGFVINHLLDPKTGEINVGAVQTLLNSPLGQHPEYRKAIMEQLAVQVLKAKGKQVGTYYHARNIKFDPNDPYNIHIEQVDNTGKVTSFGMNINAATGQVAVNFFRERGRNRYGKAAHSVNMARKKAGRKTNIAMVNMAVHAASLGNSSWESLGGLLKYEIKTDASGNTVYERESKKYLLFGKKIKKTYGKDGVELEINSTKGAQRRAKYAKELKKLDDTIMHGSHTPNATGGQTHTGWRNITESHIDPATGHTYYTVTENKGFWRKAFDPTVKTTTYYPDKVVTEFKDKHGSVIKGLTTVVHVNQFGDTSQTIRKDVEGNKYATDNYNGNTDNHLNFNGEYEMMFDNGMVNIITSGLKTEGDIRKGTAQTAAEKTIFKYSAKAQAGHDSVIDKWDGNQVVEENGAIAGDIDPRELLFGMDEIAGLTNVGGVAMKDFVKDGILAKGRKEHTNKMRSKIDWTMEAPYVADDNGNIIGRADAGGSVTGNSGTHIGSVIGGVAYDSSGHIIGHVI